jgi:hypothetical protein
MKMAFFFPHAVAMAVTSLLIGLLYVAVQQNYRSMANDPQIERAYEIRHHLKQGGSADKLFTDSIDLAQSLGVFAVMYDKQYRPIRSSGFLDGKYPQLPAGVFEYVKTHGEERVTWQPRKGIRMAMVVLEAAYPAAGFIALGRSLNEIESRETQLRTTVITCWFAVMGLIAVAALIQFRHANRQNSISKENILL